MGEGLLAGNHGLCDQRISLRARSPFELQPKAVHDAGRSLDHLDRGTKHYWQMAVRSWWFWFLDGLAGTQ